MVSTLSGCYNDDTGPKIRFITGLTFVCDQLWYDLLFLKTLRNFLQKFSILRCFVRIFRLNCACFCDNCCGFANVRRRRQNDFRNLKWQKHICWFLQNKEAILFKRQQTSYTYSTTDIAEAAKLIFVINRRTNTSAYRWSFGSEYNIVEVIHF